MAQISDVMHASAVFDAARQELAWAYRGDFTDVPEPMKGAVHSISEVLNEAEMRWVASTQEPLVVVEEESAVVAVVATGVGEKKKKREDAEVVTKEADTRSIEQAEGQIKCWLERLEEVACDMRAVAQKILLGGYSRIDDKLSARWLPCLPRRTSRADRIAPTIDTVALNLEKLMKQYDEEFGYSTGLPLAATCMEQPACSSGAGGQEGRETSVTGDVLVERDDDAKQRIIDIIHDRVAGVFDFGYPILPIFGPPGVGKTTLVKSVFHEGSFGAGYKVWFDMRKGWGIKEIQESIIDVLGRHHFAGLDLNKSCPTIRKVKSEADYDGYIRDMLEFNKTRLLLVFNNLVDLSTLDELLKFLNYAGELVITIMMTRSKDLASRILRFSKLSPYWLHPCSDNMCWEIIKRTSCIDLEATGTAAAVSEMVGCEIASKCSGIPLAAKALGRFLQSVDPQEWPGLVRDVWNIGGGFSCDSQQLRRLPTHSATVFTHLKHSSGVSDESWLSLAYCAFFVFPKRKGHGVVTRDLLNQWCCLGITTRKRGASCISELLDRSLLLGEKPASPATLLRMEDLMHDFARYQLGDRLIIVDGTNGAAPPTSSSPVNSNKRSGACLALVSNFDVKQQLDIASILPAAGILALRFEGCGEMELSEAEFESAKYACLRLLDLSGCSLKKLPHSVRHLKQLRYLRAPGITGLSPDQVFLITGLHELRYLILRRSCQLKNLTEEFQRLSNLLYLDLSRCSGLEKLPDKFGRLWRLERLDMSACSGIERLPKSFGWLRSLSHLDLSGCSRLEALPESFGWLRSLSHLDLSGCSGLEALPETFGGLHRLWHLNMSGCSGLGALPTSFEHLTELRHLDLSGLSRLKALHMVSLPRELRHLNLSGCSGLQALPESPNTILSRLRHLDLSRCTGLRDLPRSFEDLTSALLHLDLSGLSSLRALPMDSLPTELRHLNLSGCSGLQELPDADPELSELRHLDLSRCSSVSYLPDSYGELTNLVHLNLSGCSSLTKLPGYDCQPGDRLAWAVKQLVDPSLSSQIRKVPNPDVLKGLRYLDLSGCFSVDDFYSSKLVEKVRSRGGRASEPKDASLSGQGTSGTTN